MAHRFEQQIKEQRRTDDAEDGTDRHLIRIAHPAGDNIGDEQQQRAEPGDPRQTAAQIVAAETADNIRHDEAEKSDAADGNHHQRRHQRHRRHRQQYQLAIRQAERLAHLLAHADDGEAVGEPIDEAGNRAAEPKQLIAATQHPGKIAGHPGGEQLQRVILIGKEKSGGADDAAVNQPDQRQQQRVLRRNAAGNGEKTEHGRERTACGDRHIGEQRPVRHQQGCRHNTEHRPLRRAGSIRLNKAVMHRKLHHQPGDRKAGADEDNGESTRHAADPDEVPVGMRPVHHLGTEGGADRHCGEQGEDGEEKTEMTGHGG